MIESPHSTPLDKRLPVFLLTGFLGSGKTTLLKAWLTQPEFKDSALIINELGEVGLDHQLLGAATESSSLVANACVCCTGLPGLGEALEDLFWARLHRRIPPFPCLVYETTGVAEPAPVPKAMGTTEWLQAPNRMAGVITCLSAATALEVLDHHAEARAQIDGAELLVITKTDLVSSTALENLQNHLRALQPGVKLALSSHASLDSVMLLGLLRDAPARQARAHDHDQVDSHVHAHEASAHWLALPRTISRPLLLQEIARLKASLGPALLRLKGRVLTDHGALLIQLAPFEEVAAVSADPLVSPDDDAAWGLTLIVADGAPPMPEAAFMQALHASSH